MRSEDNLRDENDPEAAGVPSDEDWDEEEDNEDDQAPASPAARRKRWLIAPLILAVVVACGIGLFRYQSQEQQAIAAKIGDVPITPGMTLADFRNTLGRETSADTASDAGVAVSNGIDFKFADGMVIARFLGNSPNKIMPTQSPILVEVDRVFRGRVCGVHTTDSIPRALYYLQRHYPADKVSDDFETSHLVDLDGEWSIQFDPYQVGKDLRVGGITLRDTHWGTITSSEPG